MDKKNWTIEDIFARKIINNVTNEEKLLLAIKNKSSIYCGFDPTASSLHLGNYAQIIALKLFSKVGLKPISVLGTGTGLIGDPSFKKEERLLLSKEELNKNVLKIKQQLNNFFDKNSNHKILENYEWYKNLNCVDFLRDIGKFINISQMIHKESVASRIETGLSFTEFSYQVLQAWDFLHLYKNENCWAQLGGSDQWGNITAGIELIRKNETEANNKSVGITFNLLVNENGEKFGKSVDGAIYLDKNLTSPYQMYQYLFNQPDRMLLSLFGSLTTLSNEEIKKILDIHFEKPFLRFGQKKLLSEIITSVHGADQTEIVLSIASNLFKGNFLSLKENDLENICNNISKLEYNNAMSIGEIFIKNNIFASNREITEFINNKSIKINEFTISDKSLTLEKFQALKNKYWIIQKGKKDFWIIKNKK